MYPEKRPTGKNGVPRYELNFDQIEDLCAMHCTAREIAWFCNVSEDTLDRRIKEQCKPDGTCYSGFAEYFAINSSKGRISLRRMQWQSAKKGSIPMQVFLGKNMLDQTEKQQVDIKGITEIKVDFVGDDTEEATTEDD